MLIKRILSTLGRHTLLTISIIVSVGHSAVAVAQAPAPQLKFTPMQISNNATQAMMLDASKAGNRIVAVGEHGIVLLSDDNGKVFRQAKSVPVQVTLCSVSFTDEKNGWAVGHWGVILKTADGGETWQIQRSDITVDQPLFSVHFKDANNGWAVGLWSLMLATHDGGKTWDQVQPPAMGSGRSDRNMFKVFASEKGTLLIAAEQGTVLRSEDNGNTWSYVDTGYKGTFWSGVATVDGGLVIGGLRGNVYRSNDDGKSWQQITSKVRSSITDFVQVKGKLIAVGLEGVSLESNDNGHTFTATQRRDRLPMTAAVVASDGRPIVFSKRGIVLEEKAVH